MDPSLGRSAARCSLGASSTVLLLLRLDYAVGLEAGAGAHHSNHMRVRRDEETGNDTGCVGPASDEFPPGFFTPEEQREGGVLIYILIALYLLLAIAIVCDYYFLPSLELISDRLGLTMDVAGATFMAAGSSAPEMVTAFLGVFVTKGDIGVSTIVGSAVYNLLGICAICCLFSPSASPLSHWPLLRDSLAYAVSVAVLIGCIHDGKVHWYEALSLVSVYAAYVVVLRFDARLHRAFTRGCLCLRPAGQHRRRRQPGNGPEARPLVGGGEERGDAAGEDHGGGTSRRSSTGVNDFLHGRTRSDSGVILRDGSDYSRLTLSLHGLTSLEDEEPMGLLHVPQGDGRRVLWVLSLPVLLLLTLTVPDCRARSMRRFFPVTFFMAAVWISALTYLLVWMVTVTGETLGIPDTVMGLTLLAIGTSLPDTITSLLVAREGKADMAMSNIVGSNVFDMLCLGLPWLLLTAFVSPSGPAHVSSAGLVYSASSLLISLALLLACVHAARWRLSRPLGAACLAAYLVFVAVAVLHEVGVLGGDPAARVCGK
ncbi:sodium/potassium/calcium exchanger 5 [Petromyzon marinus]|uniref:sodium/potassium/calcium exchanger 5 n=1 Tax=Petromyzon marinus TaxID=7757 RepID=UPI003F71634B